MKLLSPILLFTLASAVLHAGFVISTTSNNITLPGSTGSVMVVQIKNQLTPAPIKKNKFDLSSKQKSTNKIITKNTASTLEKNKPSNKKELASTQQNPAKSKARVASILYKELNQHFTYPQLAIKKNWQGKVTLSLRVTSAGKIKKIKLNISSGYDILDQAAINSLSKVEYLPEISSWLPFDIDLDFPVVYKLIEG